MLSPRLFRNTLGFLLIATLCLGFQIASAAWPGDGPEQTKSSASSPPGSGEFVPGEVLVKFKSDVSPASARAALSAQDTRAVGEVPALGVQRLTVPEGQELAIIGALRHHPLVEYAEPNYIIRAVLTPDDVYFPSQWGLAKIGAPQAWDVTTGSSDLTIAIVDSGIDLDHPDLSGKIILGYDYVNGDWVPDDDHGHGTQVAGIAAAWTNNGRGVAGVSWGARLMALKVLDDRGSGSYANLANAVTYAADHGAKIINLSLGGDYDSQTLHDAVIYAHNAGCLLAVATGNEGRSAVLYPAKYAEALAVAATDSTDQRASFSNYGPEVDAAAPGVGIYSTYFGDYNYSSGTSMATPHVAGLAALIWSAYPSYTNDQVEGRIERTAVDLGAPGWDQYYGHGRIDAHAALCTSDLGANPQTITFLADDSTDPIPPSQTVSVLSTGCDPVAWTVVISPSTATWLTAIPPSGMATKISPGSISLSASKSGLAGYGPYNAQVVISATQATVWGNPQTVDVKLIYMEELYKFILFPIFKNYSW